MSYNFWKIVLPIQSPFILVHNWKPLLVRCNSISIFRRLLRLFFISFWLLCSVYFSFLFGCYCRCHFCFQMMVRNCPKNNQGFEGGCVARFLGRLSFEPLKENPLFGPSSNTLEKLGALKWDKVVHGNQAWRLITCIWLHAGVIHLLANMLSLIFIGIRLEQEFGFIRVGLIYLLSGFGGSVLSSLFIQRSISVGASGASSCRCSCNI
ncbi:hypothetical protein V6Z11_D11G008900 [Gossypium hirsutum]